MFRGSLQLFVAGIVVIGIFVTFGCSSRGGDADVRRHTDTLSDVLTRGELRAGYFIQPPAVMKDPNTGEIRGTFVDAIKQIADDAGVKVTFIEVDLAKFAAGLQARLYDVSIGPTFRTTGRAKVVAFTNTIYYLGYDGVVKRGQGSKFNSERKIDQVGVKVAVKEGSAIQTYVQKYFKNAKILVLTGTDLSLPLQAVSAGQADVGLVNEHTVEYYLRGHPDVEGILKAAPIQRVGMSWALRPDDQKWLNFLNTSLESLVATGQMARWERKHYGEALRRNIEELRTQELGGSCAE